MKVSVNKAIKIGNIISKSLNAIQEEIIRKNVVLTARKTKDERKQNAEDAQEEVAKLLDRTQNLLRIKFELRKSIAQSNVKNGVEDIINEIAKRQALMSANSGFSAYGTRIVNDLETELLEYDFAVERSLSQLASGNGTTVSTAVGTKSLNIVGYFAGALNENNKVLEKEIRDLEEKRTEKNFSNTIEISEEDVVILRDENVI